MKILPCVAIAVLVVSGAGCQRDPSPPAVDTAAALDPVVDEARQGAAIQVPPADTADVRSGVSAPIELPPADTATAPLAENADIRYTCDDGGDLRVTYSGGRANITLPDGSIDTAPLSAAASAESGGEVYVGERVGVRRIGGVVELQRNGASPRICREADGNA